VVVNDIAVHAGNSAPHTYFGQKLLVQTGQHLTLAEGMGLQLQLESNAKPEAQGM